MKNRYLFKAKIKGNNTGDKELDWIIGNLVVEQNTDRHFIIDLSHFDENTKLCNVMIEVDPSTICQCSAVRDRNKTIMFENDVVKENSGIRGVVRFGRYNDGDIAYGFYIEWDKLHPLWRNDIHYWLNRINVIGSIIDNPELLELEVQDEAD